MSPNRPSRSYLVPHVLRRLLRQRETIAYPAGPLDLPDAYRGRVTVDIARCSGCGSCARDCPCGGLEVERLEGGGVHIVIHYDRCANCGLCEASCRTGAVYMDNAFVEANADRDALNAEWTREGPRERKRR